MATLDAINLKIAKLEKQAATIAEKQNSVGLVKIRDLMHKYGLSVTDIESFVGKKRGRKPSAPAAEGATNAPQASVHHDEPKYADPKTGATWSGRGRAPLWIRDVKNRSKFLLEAGAKTASPEAKAAPLKKAPAKPAAAKKAVAKKVATKKVTVGRAASSANGKGARKAVAPIKKAAAPRKVVAKKAPVAVDVAAAPEAGAQ